MLHSQASCASYWWDCWWGLCQVRLLPLEPPATPPLTWSTTLRTSTCLLQWPPHTSPPPPEVQQQTNIRLVWPGLHRGHGHGHGHVHVSIDDAVSGSTSSFFFSGWNSSTTFTTGMTNTTGRCGSSPPAVCTVAASMSFLIHVFLFCYRWRVNDVR